MVPEITSEAGSFALGKSGKRSVRETQLVSFVLSMSLQAYCSSLLPAKAGDGQQKRGCGAADLARGLRVVSRGWTRTTSPDMHVRVSV